jgi:hypothetical protein
VARRADGKPVVRARDRRLTVRPGCDNTSVGVLITGDDGRYLMSIRTDWPAGIAPPAGHVFDWDRHGSYPDAARALVAADLRLSVKALELTTEVWRADRCGRPPAHAASATSSRSIPPSPAARRSRPAAAPAGWTPAEIGQLAGRTAEYAHGRVTDAQFFARPGIQPAWVTFLAGLGIITLAGPDLAVIDRLAQTGGPQ